MSMLRAAFATASPVVRAGAARALHTTPIVSKSATEKVKEVASDVCARFVYLNAPGPYIFMGR